MNPFRRLFGLGSNEDQRRGPRGTSRRRATRYGSGVEVELGWWAETVFQRAGGLLVDVSEGGAAALVREAVPPGSGDAFLRHAGAAEDAWIEVEIRSISRKGRESAVVHLQFSNGCSYRFFRDSMPGTDLSGPGPSYESAEFDTRIWR